MQGTIHNTARQDNPGVILGDDGVSYTYTFLGWRDAASPASPGMRVDFDVRGRHAVAIYPMPGAAPPTPPMGGVLPAQPPPVAFGAQPSAPALQMQSVPSAQSQPSPVGMATAAAPPPQPPHTRKLLGLKWWYWAIGGAATVIVLVAVAVAFLSGFISFSPTPTEVVPTEDEPIRREVVAREVIPTEDEEEANIPAPPTAPFALDWETSVSTVETGESFTLTVRMHGLQQSGEHGGISVSFPSLTQSGGTKDGHSSSAADVEGVDYTTDTTNVAFHEPGATIYHREENRQFPAEYLLVETDDDSWPAAADRTLVLRVTPKIAGDFEMQIRGWLCTDGYTRCSRVPEIGPVEDQQGWATETVSVVVVARAEDQGKILPTATPPPWSEDLVSLVLEASEEGEVVHRSGARIEIPSGATEQTITASISEVEPPHSPLGVRRAFDFTVEGSKLAEPVTIHIPFELEAGQGAADIRALHWDEGLRAWEPVPGAVDESTGTIAVTTNRFSIFSALHVAVEASCVVAPETIEAGEALTVTARGESRTFGTIEIFVEPTIVPAAVTASMSRSDVVTVSRGGNFDLASRTTIPETGEFRVGCRIFWNALTGPVELRGINRPSVVVIVEAGRRLELEPQAPTHGADALDCGRASEAECLLAGEFAPVLRLHPDERFLPRGIEGFIAQATLRDARGRIVDDDVRIEDLGEVDEPNLYVDAPSGIADSTRLPSAVYWTVRYGDELDGPENRIYLQFHLFYNYDFLSSLQKKLCGPILAVNQNIKVCLPHEADWEMIQLEFEAASAEMLVENGIAPVGVAYSQHHWTERNVWNSDTVEAIDQHPVAYVALGKHANYFGPRRNDEPDVWEACNRRSADGTLVLPQLGGLQSGNETPLGIKLDFKSPWIDGMCEMADRSRWTLSIAQDMISEAGLTVLPPDLARGSLPCHEASSGTSTCAYQLRYIDDDTPWVAYRGTWGESQVYGPDEDTRWHEPQVWANLCIGESERCVSRLKEFFLGSEPATATVTRTEDFSGPLDPERWLLFGSVSHSRTDGAVQLTPATRDQQGMLLQTRSVNLEGFTAQFSFDIGGGSGADGLGFVMLRSIPKLDRVNFDGGGTWWSRYVDGYLIAFDTHRNSRGNFEAGGGNHFYPVNDPSGNFVALAELGGGGGGLELKHLSTTNLDIELRNTGTFEVDVEFDRDGGIRIYLSNPSAGMDKELVIEHAIENYTPFDAYIGFVARTGAATDRHIIRSVAYTSMKKSEIGPSSISESTPFNLDWEMSADTVEIGDSFVLSARMHGNSTNGEHGGISISFPSLTEAGGTTGVHSSAVADVEVLDYTTATSNVTFHQAGAVIYHRENNRQFPAEYLLVEVDDASWPVSSDRTLRLRITPKVAGEFEMQIRGWLCADVYTGCVRNPAVGAATDQQGYGSKVAKIEVTGDNDQTMSANGRIAFVSDRNGDDGECDIYVMDADGSNLTRLTHGLGSAGGMTWSPDGSRIAFYRDQEGECGRYRSLELDIYVVSTDGSGVTRLTHGSGRKTYGYPEWSPDGRRIVFHSGRDREKGTDIYTMDADGSNITRLTYGSGDDFNYKLFPEWSPDGRRIVFHYQRGGRSDIYVMDEDGSDVSRLTSGSGRMDSGWPAWSPDGRRISFRSDRDRADDQWDIYVMNADGSGVSRLTQGSGDEGYFVHGWSPDGKRVAFASDRDRQEREFDIYVANADGSDLTRLTHGSGTEDSLGHSWSPDGQHFAFHSDRDRDDDQFDIYVMNADGSNFIRLTDGNGNNRRPIWSPAGLSPAPAVKPTPQTMVADGSFSVEIETSTSSVIAGESFTLTARMFGNRSAGEHGGISVSFPSLNLPSGSNQRHSSSLADVEVVDYTTGASNVAFHQAGAAIYHKVNNRQFPAEYLLVESDDPTWPMSSDRTLRLRITPKLAGEFEMQIRGWLCADVYTLCDRVPETGSLEDQQGWVVVRMSVQVEPSSTTIVNPPPVNAGIVPTKTLVYVATLDRAERWNGGRRHWFVARRLDGTLWLLTHQPIHSHVS